MHVSMPAPMIITRRCDPLELACCTGGASTVAAAATWKRAVTLQEPNFRASGRRAWRTSVGGRHAVRGLAAREHTQQSSFSGCNVAAVTSGATDTHKITGVGARQGGAPAARDAAAPHCLPMHTHPPG